MAYHMAYHIAYHMYRKENICSHPQTQREFLFDIKCYSTIFLGLLEWMTVYDGSTDLLCVNNEAMVQRK